MKTSSKRLLLLTLFAGIFAIAASSCNTTRGLGRDVRKVGNHIERAAD
ncbi:MAG TPA: entericidin A/B family lipoprotein [Prosthecobacter sp.]|nr:entericidin A/B family lipoprotein [Prosthecobacter sp.]